MPDVARLPDWPRALREELAAAYVGLSPSTFRAAVAPAVPAVRLTTGRVAWLRDHLDAWLDARQTDAAGAPVDAPPAAGDAAPPEPQHAARPSIRAALSRLAPARGARRPNAAR